MCSKSTSNRKEPQRSSKLEIGNSIQSIYNSRLPNKSPTFAELSWKKSMDFEKYASKASKVSSLGDWNLKLSQKSNLQNELLEDSLDLSINVERKLADAFYRERVPLGRSPNKEIISNKENASSKCISKKKKRYLMFIFIQQNSRMFHYLLKNFFFIQFRKKLFQTKELINHLTA